MEYGILNGTILLFRLFAQLIIALFLSAVIYAIFKVSKLSKFFTTLSQYECKICEQRFYRPEDIFYHLEEQHEEEVNKKNEVIEKFENFFKKKD